MIMPPDRHTKIYFTKIENNGYILWKNLYLTCMKPLSQKNQSENFVSVKLLIIIKKKKGIE